MAATMRSGSIVRRTGSMSANTGRAPVIMIARAVYAAESAQCERDGVGAVADADGVRRASRGGEFRFERLDFRSQHEPAPRDHPVDRAPHVRRIFTGRKRHEGNLPDAHTRAVLSAAST